MAIMLDGVEFCMWMQDKETASSAAKRINDAYSEQRSLRRSNAPQTTARLLALREGRQE